MLARFLSVISFLDSDLAPDNIFSDNYRTVPVPFKNLNILILKYTKIDDTDFYINYNFVHLRDVGTGTVPTYLSFQN